MTVVTHVMRSPIVGGSELETLAITRRIDSVRHRVVFPDRFAHLGPSIAARFAVEVEPVPNIEDAMRAAPGPIHVQYPFVMVDRAQGLDSVLELRSLPLGRTAFTVHAAVNVPLVEGLEYVFHTARQARRFEPQLAPARVWIAPSLVEVRDGPPRGLALRQSQDDGVEILWVSRNDDAKFHDAVPWIVEQVLAREPAARFRFIGVPQRFALPASDRVAAVACPGPVDEALRRADLFWHFPHALVEETWCRTVTEAMAAGLPCLAASWGAMAEQLQQDAGLLATSPDDAVQGLCALVRQPERRRAMGVAGSARARRFFDDAVQTLTRLYAALA